MRKPSNPFAFGSGFIALIAFAILAIGDIRETSPTSDAIVMVVDDWYAIYPYLYVIAGCLWSVARWRRSLLALACVLIAIPAEETISRT